MAFSTVKEVYGYVALYNVGNRDSGKGEEKTDGEKYREERGKEGTGIWEGGERKGSGRRKVRARTLR